MTGLNGFMQRNLMSLLTPSECQILEGSDREKNTKCKGKSFSFWYPFIHLLHLHILHFPLFTFLQSVKFYHPWNPQFSFQRRYRTKSKTQTEFYKNSTQVEASSCTSASTGASAETCHSGPVSWQRHAPLPQAETHIRPKWPFLGPKWQRHSL